MAKILVVGGSKGIGLACVKEALARGHGVRALARSAGDMALDDPSLEKRAGDATSAGDVTAALVGVDAVIQALGVPAGKLLRPVKLFSQATSVLIPAMEQAGVKRLIAVTGFGAGDSRKAIARWQRLPFRAFLGRAYDDKSVQERMIEQSGLDWTIVRPGVLTNGTKTDRYKVLTEPEAWRNGIISRADVAAFVVDQIDKNEMIGKKPVIIHSPL